MIISDQIGGLGNQLFMYAAARRLALRRNVALKLNIAHFSIGYDLHKYSMSNLNIVENFATIEDLTRVLYDGDLFQEPNAYIYEPRINTLRTPLYLRGYFQSFRYFDDIEDVIRSEFQVKTPPTGLNAQVLDMIANSNAVCVHIRRADYTNPTTAMVHGLVGVKYYLIALNHIAAKVENPKLFVFSDDIYWAQENLRINLPTIFVGHNTAAHNYEDLRLMSACKHFVIANSSFSWWGAWLSPHPDKIVCAPARWVNSNPDTRNLLPESWIRVPV